MGDLTWEAYKEIENKAHDSVLATYALRQGTKVLGKVIHQQLIPEFKHRVHISLRVNDEPWETTLDFDDLQIMDLNSAALQQMVANALTAALMKLVLDKTDFVLAFAKKGK